METLQPDKERPEPASGAGSLLSPLPAAYGLEKLGPWERLFPTGWAQAWGVGSRAWELRMDEGPLFLLWFWAWEPNSSLLDLLNPLATSQSQQVLLPEPFITPIPGSARSGAPWRAGGGAAHCWELRSWV